MATHSFVQCNKPHRDLFCSLRVLRGKLGKCLVHTFAGSAGLGTAIHSALIETILLEVIEIHAELLGLFVEAFQIILAIRKVNVYH